MPGSGQKLSEIKQAVRAGGAPAVGRLLAEDPHLVHAQGQGWTPLQDAAFLGKAAVLEVMLSQGAGITPEHVVHALHHAIQLPHRSPQVVELLIGTGMVPEAVAALFREDMDALAVALRADPGLAHAADAEGYTLLLRAAELGSPSLVGLLLEHGADLEARGPFGKSALSACACNQIDVKRRSATLRFLLERGADVNGRTGGGRTPLFSAATAGWHPEESVRVLLEGGADPNLRDESGRSVLQEVEAGSTGRQRRVAELLRAHGAA